ncbi:copper chaperone CopZ [Staphylococcus pettenkoferi]|uniref:copper chaperone CopZ n=1 Tax=Staphylococcus pettenkoferi TaxID=170573 RepID=UPI000F53DC77|nr:copper chaperone CopZ [Staphylococcus pettenkoferi]MCY1572515.1 copper chaperone CopZ [Staphylococcus pettenkoferi]MCY1593032.1 copper chaperone CopZ [Staphylococcus pettenkoferi]MCY1597714.1 copper chaperone CopZ [Staphylococcus pettenkoferi]MCY1601299.1 copper chaperone CopZ [Staphylococcus pettenkoferi]MCY1605737.1 copper chaperone CopZ [Staphylococcus pettenkoferi]
MANQTIQVEGMSCEHCKNAVETALKDLDGVSQAEVSLEQGQVNVDYDDSKFDFEDMRDAIEDQGYDVNA